MDPLVELLILLALIYGLECAQWVPRGTLAFQLPIAGGRWRARRPWRGSARWQRGAAFGTPWPPLSSALVAQELPLLMGPAGVASSVGARPWNEIQSVATRDHWLELDNERVARVATRRLGNWMVSALDTLRKIADPKSRTRKLARLLDQRFETKAVAPRLVQLRRRALSLRIACNGLWVGLFLCVPVMLFTPLITWWLVIVGAVAAAWLTCAVFFYRLLRVGALIDRRCWPDLLHRVLAFASPLSAMRATDLIARELVGELDPLAVGAALLSPAEFGERARIALAELKHAPHSTSEQVAATGDAEWMRHERIVRIERLVRDAGLATASLMSPPARDDDRSASWCPRCRSQYAHGETCSGPSCRGIALTPF